MQALIDPTTSVQYVSSWDTTVTPNVPVFSTYPNSARICQIEPDSDVFQVAKPLFWTACSDSINTNEFYYDTADQNFQPIVNVPKPAPTL